MGRLDIKRRGRQLRIGRLQGLLGVERKELWQVASERREELKAVEQEGVLGYKEEMPEGVELRNTRGRETKKYQREGNE